MRTCDAPDCRNPHRARGLCSTHYNQRDPDRHPRVVKPCEACGTPVEREARVRYRTACSTRCRNLLTWGRPEGTTYTWDADAQDRARRAGAAIVEPISRDVVGTRDRWTCQVCHRPTDRTADPIHPDAPTVDHVVPLSKGGQHTMANVQVACYSCNSRKRDTMADALTCTDAGGRGS